MQGPVPAVLMAMQQLAVVCACGSVRAPDVWHGEDCAGKVSAAPIAIQCTKPCNRGAFGPALQ